MTALVVAVSAVVAGHLVLAAVLVVALLLFGLDVFIGWSQRTVRRVAAVASAVAQVVARPVAVAELPAPRPQAPRVRALAAPGVSQPCPRCSGVMTVAEGPRRLVWECDECGLVLTAEQRAGAA